MAEAAREEAALVEITNIIKTLPKHPTKKYSVRATNFITQFVVHHTAAKEDGLPDSDAMELRSWKAIADYHVRHNGWPAIGYTYGITEDGSVYKLNNTTTLAYHAGAGQNKKSLGIVLLGNFEVHVPTSAQITALEDLLAELLRVLPGRVVIPHRAVHATACPGRHLVSLLPGIVSRATARATSPSEPAPHQ